MGRNFKRFLAGIVGTLLVFAGSAGLRSLSLAQIPLSQVPLDQQTLPGMPPDASGRRSEQIDPAQKELLAKMAIQRNTQRQQQLVKDTDKLLALATELKSDVDKTNKDVLSIDVIKKADEIEKLAKSVKDRMKN